MNLHGVKMRLEHEFHEDESDEWATPKEFVRPLDNAVGGFDLDPASGAEPEPHADETYTKEDNGLEREWFGNVFLNPPFSNKNDWVEKAINEINAGNADLVLTVLPCDTSTTWFHKMVQNAPIHCFIGPGRQEFDRRSSAGNNGSPAFPVLIAVFGNKLPKQLLGVLNKRGVVYWNDSLYTECKQVRFET